MFGIQAAKKGLKVSYINDLKKTKRELYIIIIKNEKKKHVDFEYFFKKFPKTKPYNTIIIVAKGNAKLDAN